MLINETEGKFASTLNEVPGHEDVWGLDVWTTYKKKSSSLPLQGIEPRFLSCPIHDLSYPFTKQKQEILYIYICMYVYL